MTPRIRSERILEWDFPGSSSSDSDFEHKEPLDLTTDKPDNPAVNSRSKITDPLPWTIMVVALVFDQLTKWTVIENLAVGESWPATGFFRFTHAWNTGTAFSLFQGQGDILMWVSLAAVAVLTWIYRSIDNPPWVIRIAFGLQFGGAIGNIVDRVRIGHVTDFIDIGWWPVFNIADSSIVVGIGLMIFYFWFLDQSSKSEENSGDQTVETLETTEPATVNTSLDSPE